MRSRRAIKGMAPHKCEAEGYSKGMATKANPKARGPIAEGVIKGMAPHRCEAGGMKGMAPCRCDAGKIHKGMDPRANAKAWATSNFKGVALCACKVKGMVPHGCEPQEHQRHRPAHM